MSSEKRQFLDPIGTVCRIMLLCFSPVGTKLRVINHRLELTENNFLEKLVVRKWFGDSKHDICVLFPVIVRFIEHYLCPPRLSQNSDIKHDDDADFDDTNPIECIESLRTIARFAQRGLAQLGGTYGSDNTTFALQYFTILLDNGINDTYRDTNYLIPDHLKGLTSNTFFNFCEIQKLWSNEEINFVCKTVESWLHAVNTSNLTLAESHKASVMNLLNAKDDIFLRSVTLSNMT